MSTDKSLHTKGNMSKSSSSSDMSRDRCGKEEAESRNAEGGVGEDDEGDDVDGRMATPVLPIRSIRQTRRPTNKRHWRLKTTTTTRGVWF
eukprot:scaffold20443_cov148-Cylindrotheca_fusiformis.AAC.1